MMGVTCSTVAGVDVSPAAGNSCSAGTDVHKHRRFNFINPEKLLVFMSRLQCLIMFVPEAACLMQPVSLIPDTVLQTTARHLLTASVWHARMSLELLSKANHTFTLHHSKV